ncbi:MAG: ABC transporter permease subunit [Patescibacteria group bacterium]|jgi:thiamine transport system permease protein
MESILQNINWQAVLDKTWFSFWQSLLTVYISLLLGGGLAVLEYFLKSRPSKIFLFLCSLPIFLPGLVVATGFMAIWGNAGYVNELLSLFDISPIKFLYSPFGIIAGHCFYNIPLAYLALATRLTLADRKQEEAGQIAGGSSWQVFFLITWPRLKNTAIGIGLLIFLYCFTSFNLPLILGGIKYQTLEVYIYSLAVEQYNFFASVALGIFQFIFLLIIVFIFLKFLRTVSEKNVQSNAPYQVSFQWSLFILRFLLAVFLVAPLLALLAKGVNMDIIRIWRTDFTMALLRTYSLIFISIFISLFFNGFILYKIKNAGKWLVLFLAISPAVVGIALLLIFGKSLLVLVAAYTVLMLPLSYFLLSSLWQSRPKYFLETLAILGANKTQKAMVIAGYLRPAILKVIALSFAFTLGDVALSSLLTPFLQPTAMSYSYQLLGSYRFGLASSALCVILLNIILMIIIIYNYDFRSKRSHG